MLFQKSFFSFVTAIALVTSVSASSIASRDIVPQCPTGLNAYCCTSSPSFSGLPDGPKNALANNGDVDQSKPVCVGCSTPPTQGCPIVPLCCTGMVTADNQPIGYNCQTPSNADQNANSVATGQGQAGQPEGDSSKVSNGAKNGAQH